MTLARSDYQEEAQRRLNEVEAMLNIFCSRLYVARRGDRTGTNRNLVLLRGQKLVVENRLSELLAADDSDWPKQRDRFESAAGGLEEATAAALKRLR